MIAPRGGAPGEVVVATRNPGKLRELVPMFGALGVAVVDLDAAGIPEHPDEDAVEAFDTFEANALAKARYFFARSGGRPCVADDSGLEVHALGGAPGVRSRRYAGAAGTREAVDAANNALLVRELAGVADRRARFVCAAAFVDAERELVRVGLTDGSILDDPRGGLGFGYDPHFLSADLGLTFGMASREEKARVSHRARAFASLVKALRGGGAGSSPGRG